MALKGEMNDENVAKTFYALEELEKETNGPEDLAKLIDKYRESIANGTWEFIGTDNFVSAQSQAADGFRDNCEAQNIPCPEPPTWRAVGRALSRAMWMS